MAIDSTWLGQTADTIMFRTDYLSGDVTIYNVKLEDSDSQTNFTNDTATLDDGNPNIIQNPTGTNASDQVSDRPGMKALRELEVRSPLRECGITKTEVRRLSKEAGLFTWDKPSYACLATRIPTGEQITAEKLKITEKSEDYLSSLGFKDFRIRMRGGAAVVQTHAAQNSELDMHKQEITDFLAKHYKEIHFEPGSRDE